MSARLSVVIPTYNEERRLPPTLDRLNAFFRQQPYSWEIIISDDGSVDGTIAAAQRMAAEMPVRILSDGQNYGKGRAVRRGVLAAAGENILFTDADLSTPIEEVHRLLEALDHGFDVAIASRGMRASRLEAREPWYRELVGRAGNLLIQAVAAPGIHDTQCGFKLFQRDAAQQIFSRSVIDSICFDVELIFLARKLGYRVKEVPVRWRHDPDSRIRVLRESYRMIRDLFRIRLIHRRVTPSIC